MAEGPTQKNGKPASAPAAEPVAASSPLDITQSPEFQMAFAEATARMHEEIMASVKEMVAGGRSPAGDADDSDIQRLARAIALSNAEIADQGTNRKRVAPEVLERRRLSLERMHALLREAQNLPKADRPIYRVRSKTYIRDDLIEPFQRGAGGRIDPTYVVFMSAPNLALLPHNDSAKAIYEAFIGSLGGGHALLDGVALPSTEPLPMYMTQGGAVVTTITQTAEAHRIGVLDIPPIDARLVPEVGQGGVTPAEIVSVDDPRATKIPVLGTLAAPATRGAQSPRAA